MFSVTKITHERIKEITAIVVVGCVIIIFISGFSTFKSRYRDMRRRADIAALVQALEVYHDKYGVYPVAEDDWRGWNLSLADKNGKTNFLSRLYEEKMINSRLADPLNDPTYHYRYRKYNAGEFGCANGFYILQITNFELLTSNNGTGQCPEYDWSKLAPNGLTLQNTD